MRKLALISLLFAAAACDGGSTGPQAAQIHVRVVDDRGIPVDRMPFTVSGPSSSAISSRTGSSGTASVPVAAAGTYQVTVIPRAGYVGGAQPFTRTVSVADRDEARVEFMVSREGIEPRP